MMQAVEVISLEKHTSFSRRPQPKDFPDYQETITTTISG